MGVHKVSQARNEERVRRAHAVFLPLQVDSAPPRAHEMDLGYNFREDGMESLLYIALLVGIWVVLVKVVFPKIGIQG